MRLLDAEQVSGLRLRQPALPDDPVDLQRELRLEELLLGIGQAEVGKQVAAAARDPGFLRRQFCLSR